MNIGLTVFSAKNPPFLNFAMPLPFVVPPSANIRNGAYAFVSSISICLSFIAFRAFAFCSSFPPLGIQIQSTESISVFNSGTS
jgi:hypothetical protein